MTDEIHEELIEYVREFLVEHCNMTMGGEEDPVVAISTSEGYTLGGLDGEAAQLLLNMRDLIRY